MSIIKNWLKKIIPPPVDVFNREIERVLTAVETEKRLINENMRLTHDLFARLDKDNKALLEIKAELKTEYEASRQIFNLLEEEQQKSSDIILRLDEARQSSQEILSGLNKEKQRLEETMLLLKNEKQIMNELMKVSIPELNKSILDVKYQAYASKIAAEETIWAQIFNDTIINSDWLMDKTFSPGRWAVGYPFLYILYRVLNEIKPKKILELGLGQSTRMTAQYVNHYRNIDHYIVEHDLNWINFFELNYKVPSSSEIIKLDWKMANYMGFDIRVFDGFQKEFENKVFDFILIDAPFGQDMQYYARIDIISILPKSIMPSFVIMIDDYNRNGEKATVEEMKKILDKSEIDYALGIYSGKKDLLLLCSRDLEFLTSM